jgi:phage baseplate assembly protein V
MAERYDKEITDLKRRVSNSVVVGVVSKVDHQKGRYRVKAGELESDWIPMATPRAGKTSIYSSFEEGEQVVLASPSGDLSQAVILGAVATGTTQAGDKGNLHRIKYPDGTVITYDHEAKKYTMDVAEGGSFALNIGGGVSFVAEGGKLTIKAPGGTVLESPNFDVNP